MAGGARDATSRWRLPRQLFPPESLVSATRVGTRMTIVVATDASFDRGMPGVETVSAVAAIAPELGMPYVFLHR